MSDVKQIYSILNDVAKQTLGTEAIAVVDTQSFISLGDKVLKSDTDTENFLSKLTDRIAKTVYSVRNYTGINKNLMREPFDYGVIVQKKNPCGDARSERKQCMEDWRTRIYTYLCACY